MPTKIYTAQELRDAAVSPTYVGGVSEVRVKPEVYEMLEQAADVVEENAKLRTLLASTVGYTCTLCGMKSSKMCGTCAVFKAQEILEGGNDEQH